MPRRQFTSLPQAPTDEAATAALIRNLGQALGGSGGGLESARSDSLESAQRKLGPAQRNNYLDALQKRIAPAQRNSGGLQLARLSDGMDQLHAQGSAARLDAEQRMGLEALVSLNGRPALAAVDKPGGGQTLGLDLYNPSAEQKQELGEFHTPLTMTLNVIEQRLPSVGRIDSGGQHSGTGFVVGDDLILTNRHVLELLADPRPGAVAPARWDLDSDATIDFSPTPSAADGARRFRLREVIFAGPDPIWDVPYKPGRVDAALLRVDRTSETGQPLPPVLDFAANPNLAARTRLLVCGYPAEPQSLPTDASGATRRDVVERLFQIFGLDYGNKYLSPGKLMTYTQALTVFDHDATTLPGSSGSCVLLLDNRLSGVGLHFAGQWLQANQAHSVRELHSSGKAPALAGLRWV